MVWFCHDSPALIFRIPDAQPAADLRLSEDIQMKQKNIFIAAAALLILVFAGGALLYQKQQTEQAAQLAKQNMAALVRMDAPSFGNADAPVHIVEFFDPACGTCREV